MIDPVLHPLLEQEQFLDVIDRDEAERRFRSFLNLRPLEEETVSLAQALGRVLARDVIAPLDVPGFDRSNVDGFAVQSVDTFGAEESSPVRLRLLPGALAPGEPPTSAVAPGTALAIATGSMMPRGADAVVMVEHTETAGDQVWIRRPAAPGGHVSFAGTDIGRGETVLRRGDLLTSRDTGVLAALGVSQVVVVRRPRVAILSTGSELVAPGQPLRPGQIYDSNATILADAVRELGGVPVPMGIVPDDQRLLRGRLEQALLQDVVLVSGGTSKGPGDISYRVVADLGPPGIVAHGVALKPGKPLCLAAVGNKPLVLLPGFPTSAIFTFHEFVAPLILLLAGKPAARAAVVTARLPGRLNSERGRTEYVLAGLVEGREGLVAYPMGKGSGSVTTFSRADGFVAIPRQRECLDAGEKVEVQLLGQDLRPADLIVIGSHCVGLDYLLGKLQEQGYRCKFLAVGSLAGLAAARRGECDLAGIHLLDSRTKEYNRPFLSEDLMLIPGYGRRQGLVFRAGDPRFEGKGVIEALNRALADPECHMVNRNRGSGTRVLIDGLLGQARPPGFATEVRSHNAVAAAVVQGRADWGVCIETVAKGLGLVFLPLQDEQFDLVVPRSRLDRKGVAALREILDRSDTRAALANLGFTLPGRESLL